MPNFPVKMMNGPNKEGRKAYPLLSSRYTPFFPNISPRFQRVSRSWKCLNLSCWAPLIRLHLASKSFFQTYFIILQHLEDAVYNHCCSNWICPFGNCRIMYPLRIYASFIFSLFDDTREWNKQLLSPFVSTNTKNLPPKHILFIFFNCANDFTERASDMPY